MFRYIAFSAVACSQTLYFLFKVSRACKFLHFYSTLFTEILLVSVRGLPSYRKIPKISHSIRSMYKPLQI